MSRYALSRRTFLKGVGASVALPALECMLNGNGNAYADTGAPLPKRFATFFFGNGVRLDRWIPAATGPTWELSPALAPLANVKPYVNVVTGYTAKAAGSRGHHGGLSAMLSGMQYVELEHATTSYSSKFGGPSIDQIVATHIAGNTPHPTLELGVSKRIISGEGPTLQFISHRGPDVSLASDTNPANVFSRLFTTLAPPTDPRSRLRVSVLDAVKDDILGLNARLGVNDRRRLDAHLTAISELRARILALPPIYTGACQPPNFTVAETNADVNGQEPLDAVSHIMADMLALAWVCDINRVASVQYTGSVGFTLFDMVGATAGHHDLTHNNTPEAQNLVHLATVHTVEQFAYLAQKLKDMPEGAGNVLDQSLLMLTSDCQEGLSHLNDDYPLVLAGKAGGAMKYPGVHRRGIPRLDNTNDILVSILSAMGTPLTGIGAGESRSDRAVVQILA